jgi:hypothetical protein
MTEARIVPTVASVEAARVFLAQARRLAADGGVEQVSGTGRQLLLYQSCLAACDAALVAVGQKVEGDEGGHALRLSETAGLLSLDDELAELLDDARRIRAGSAYRAGVVFEHELEDAKEAARRLLSEVERFIADQAPTS